MTTVLLHAIGLDRHQWNWCMGWSGVLAVDLPGCGTEPPLAGEITMALVADQVASQVAALEVGPVDLVGLSLGGMVVQHVALRHPDLVRSAVLVCTKASTDPEAMEARAVRTMAIGMSGTVEETMRRWFTEAALADPGHWGVSYARQRLNEDHPDIIASYWRAMASHDLRRQLGAMELPVTIVHGRQDVTSSDEQARQFAALFPRARVDIVDGPHLLCLEQPHQVVQAVRAHSRWVEAGAPTHWNDQSR